MAIQNRPQSQKRVLSTENLRSGSINYIIKMQPLGSIRFDSKKKGAKILLF